MAILKAVKSMVSTLASLKEKINYCRNPHKTGSIEPAVAGISSDPIKAFEANKLLHSKANRQRLYKEFIISMQAVWPEEHSRNQEYQTLMGKLMGSAMRWWEELGFQVLGAIHCNTAHPHIHLVVDTCNVRSGKQLSQSRKMLADFKVYLSAAMNDLGFDEDVLGQIEVSEGEMMTEDDLDSFGFVLWKGGDNVDCECFGGAGKKANGIDMMSEDTINSGGTRAIYTVPPPLSSLLKEGDRERYYREMCKIIAPSNGREMCKIVDNSVRGREMCKLVDKPTGTVERWNTGTGDKEGPDEVRFK